MTCFSLPSRPLRTSSHGQPEVPVAPLLAAGLEHAPGLLHRGHQPLALVDRQRERLLAVHVLAGLQRGRLTSVCQWSGVPLMTTSTSLRSISLRKSARPAPVVLLAARGVALVHVAKGDDAAEPAGVLGVAPAHAAAADQADAGLVVGGT